MRNLNKMGTGLLAMVVVVLLSACDGGGASVDSNQLPDAGEPGSKPNSSLSFAPRELKTEVSNGSLRTLLSNTDDKEQNFDELQALMFGPMCSGCHFGGGIEQPSLFDFTTAESTYRSLVSQPSTKVAGAILVTPGSVEQSYLVNTLNGTQATGPRMPMRAAPLPDELLVAVKSWITKGAPR